MSEEASDRARRRRLAAVVLAKADHGEADLIVTFLTRELGLLKALARHGRRSRRRFGGGLLSPGTAAWYDFTFKPHSSLAFVEKGEAEPKAYRLPPEPLIQALAAFALELVRAFEAPRNPAAPSFNLLVRHLGRLARGGGERAARLAALAFSANYLELAGFAPTLTSCLVCGAPAGPEASGWRWDPASGGLHCPLCPGRPEASPVPPGVLASLSKKNPAGQASPALKTGELAEAEFFFEKLAAHHLGRPLKALRVARSFFRER